MQLLLLLLFPWCSATEQLTAETDCTLCTAGEYCPNTTMTTTEGQCEAGWYCYEGSTKSMPTDPLEGGECPTGASIHLWHCSFVHWSIHSFIHLICSIHPFNNVLIHSKILIQLVNHSSHFIYSLYHSFHLYIHIFIHSFIIFFFHSPILWSMTCIHPFNHPLIHYIFFCSLKFIHLFIQSFIYSSEFI